MKVTSALPQSTPPAGDAAPAGTPAGGSTFADLVSQQLPAGPVPAGERASPKAQYQPAEAASEKPMVEGADTAVPEDTDRSAVLAEVAADTNVTVPVLPAMSIGVVASPQVLHGAPDEPAADAGQAADAFAKSANEKADIADAAHAKPAVTASTVAVAAVAAAVAEASANTSARSTDAQLPDSENPALGVVASTPAADHARTTHGIPARVADAAPGDPAAVTQSAHPNPQPVAQSVPQPAAAQVQATRESVVAARPAHLAADVAVEVVRQAAAGRQEFTIRLDPPDLGRIDVSLQFHRGEVRAVVSTDNPATHDLLRRDSDGFARILSDSGFRTDGNALRFDLRDGSQQRSFAGDAQFDRSGGATTHRDTEILPPPARRHGLLDLVA